MRVFLLLGKMDIHDKIEQTQKNRGRAPASHNCRGQIHTHSGSDVPQAVQGSSPGVTTFPGSGLMPDAVKVC